MTRIFVDADACPVKEEVEKVANRHGIAVVMVTDGGIRPSRNPLISLQIVPPGPDSADDWIAEAIAGGDICVTNDIPLAARCLEKDAFALKPNGDAFTEQGIGMALAGRSLMQALRETGAVTGGPPAFRKADRSAFLNALEVTVQRAKRHSTGTR